MEFVATIHVRPKGEVRDPQGEAIAGALRSLGLEVRDVRAGKELIVRFAAADAAAAGAAADLMGRELLANPVIEDFSLEVVPI
ncbi:MAG TPA: phosphoribosylformylglycinamidine synthase subunit PurS [Candidatus Limnocylindrales bacterium]|nr:phosphoribosylformylglycinamidine synthase subunit PurS [Candidatus Limnocylindrales bacterium]